MCLAFSPHEHKNINHFLITMCVIVCIICCLKSPAEPPLLPLSISRSSSSSSLFFISPAPVGHRSCSGPKSPSHSGKASRKLKVEKLPPWLPALVTTATHRALVVVVRVFWALRATVACVIAGRDTLTQAPGRGAPWG